MIPKISLILPVFNEKENISTLLNEIRRVFSALPNDWEIILVDDGSTDGTHEVLKWQRRENLRVITFRCNVGQTAAIAAGIEHATGDICVTMDSDLQNDPADIPSMLRLIQEGHDCVLGFRKKRHDASFTRKLPSQIANWLIRKLWKSTIKDMGCGLKVIRMALAKEIPLYGEMHRFLGLIIQNMGAKIIEIPVNHRPRVHGKSKYNLSRTYKVWLDLITFWFLQRFRTKPIYIFGGIGLVFGGISALLVGWVLYDKFVLEVAVHRNPLFILSVCFAGSGIFFVGLGLIAELLIRIYFEATKRKPYLIKDSTQSLEPVLSSHSVNLPTAQRVTFS